jgi:hypothetical protein
MSFQKMEILFLSNCGKTLGFHHQMLISSSWHDFFFCNKVGFEPGIISFFLAQKSWINPITDVFNAYQMQIALTQISILKLHQTRTNIPTSGNNRKPPKKNRISSPTG